MIPRARPRGPASGGLHPDRRGAGLRGGRRHPDPAVRLVGSIALLIAADFPGTAATRATAYAILAIAGTVLITAGTLAAPYPLVAVPLCLVVGALVVFLGLLSDAVAAGQRATLMTFILPVCIRPRPARRSAVRLVHRAGGLRSRRIAGAAPALPQRTSALLGTGLLGDRRPDRRVGLCRGTHRAMAVLQKAFLDNAFGRSH